MILTRTPLRISLAGGGSDMAVFYRQQPGAVLSTTIDKYVWVGVHQKFEAGIRVAYSKVENVASAAQVEHRLVRACLQELGVDSGVEIHTVADIPAQGTGLGSSSAFTVGLLHALNRYKRQAVDAEKLAAQACEVEIELCGEPIGKQDQYAAAFGGFNLIEFKPDDSVSVQPLTCDDATLGEIQRNTLLLYTGITRSASALLQAQSAAVAASAQKHRALGEMVKLAYALRDELQSAHASAVGQILHENWLLKKSLCDGISNPQIDAWYAAARQAGATGGKILGAGAGGFLMLYAPVERHASIQAALPGLRPFPVSLDPLGSQVIVNP